MRKRGASAFARIGKARLKPKWSQVTFQEKYIGCYLKKIMQCLCNCYCEIKNEWIFNLHFFLYYSQGKELLLRYIESKIHHFSKKRRKNDIYSRWVHYHNIWLLDIKMTNSLSLSFKKEMQFWVVLGFNVTLFNANIWQQITK